MRTNYVIINKERQHDQQSVPEGRSSPGLPPAPRATKSACLPRVGEAGVAGAEC